MLMQPDGRMKQQYLEAQGGKMLRPSPRPLDRRMEKYRCLLRSLNRFANHELDEIIAFVGQLANESCPDRQAAAADAHTRKKEG